jgi:hypothetical protein
VSLYVQQPRGNKRNRNDDIKKKIGDTTKTERS